MSTIEDVRDEDIRRMAGEHFIMKKALELIEQWDFPKQVCDGYLVSYSYAKGSNGEREYTRKIARETLKQLQD